MKRDLQLLPPETLTGLSTTAPKDRAAGTKAVTVALKHVASELGLGEGLKLLNRMNQEHGFDCPGCAWPDPVDRSGLGEYCENGAKALAEEATNKKCDPAFFARHDLQEMSTWSDYKLGKSGRITAPMYLAPGAMKYTPISWEDAFTRVAEGLKSAGDANRNVFYTSGRTSNETAYLYQLLARLHGTNNLPDCSNMCHESSGVGLSETVGIGKGSVTLEDLYEAEVILVVGQNPGTNHPRMLSALQKNKQNGGTVVHINPLPEAGTLRFVDPQSPVEVLKGGTKLADHFLQVRVGGDAALFKLIMQRLLQLEATVPTALDRTFIAQHTEGFDALVAALEQLDTDQALQDCGVPLAAIHQLADLLARKQKIIICWAMGITQHVHGVANVQEIVNLLLMKGSIGKPGAGTCPVRGHSNVQGDRTMGIWEKPKEPFLAALDERFNFTAPREHGYDVVSAIGAMEQGKVDVFMCMGGNFISATPDSERTAKAVQNCKLTVQVSTKLNRSHIITGEEALILPCLGRSEKDMGPTAPQFMSVENSMGIVHTTRGTRKPVSNRLKSEVAIVCGIGERLTGTDHLDWSTCAQNYDVIRDHIEATIPGFKRYNERIRHPQGFYLPNGARKGEFNTANGKANFKVHPLPDVSVQEGELIMMTLRSHDQYNTTIYGLDDRYRGIQNERRVILMHPEDMRERGLQEKQLVNIASNWKGVQRQVRQFHVVPFDIARGCVGTYFPECNALVPLEHKAKKSHTPASKFVPVVVEAL